MSTSMGEPASGQPIPGQPIPGQPIPGQRWVSDNEPELGLGVVVRVTTGRVEINFPAANEQRQYALGSAPLRRVVFKEGDQITSQLGAELVVDGVVERDGLLFYQAAGLEVEEGELAATISFTSPEERLLGGHLDPLSTFDLRAEALHLRSQIQGSPIRGYVGGRIELIPHQLSIAGEVASRSTPRVLLADEVGLGKTIEAGLILHRLHLTGRADRVLLLVPEPLVHQWFVELLRRFNLPFSIFDEERCASIEEHQPDANPFLENQLILSSVDLLSDNRRRTLQAVEAGWDLLVVDEAHHLAWHPEHASDAYTTVEALAGTISGLLLLTATPQQLGPEGHFARLRLLDPDRYVDIDRFLDEADGYESVARAVDRVIDGKPLTPEDHRLFAAGSERVRRDSEELAAGVPGAGDRLIADLLDSFGTGRVMFRNTRAALDGFPERKAFLVALDGESMLGNEPSWSDEISASAVKVRWLARLLKELPEEKLLLICRTQWLAEEIHSHLPHEINVPAALFHEGLSLVQRDRNAAYFADDEGARILICSEVGSEGRNFQFAHHLVLFDLPTDPELLEQRIGRLDRIGQSGRVNIHVPYLPGTKSEVLARWYHEGLNAFEENLHGAADVVRELKSDLSSLLKRFDADALERLIERSHQERTRVAEKLEHGYDRLLQLNSNKPERAAELSRQIRAADRDRSFEEFVLRLLEYYGVHIEELAPRTYLFRPDLLLTDAFPPLPSDGLAVTFDRARALIRDDIGFMTWDHPFLRSVIDLLVEGEQGNATFGMWNDSDDEGILLELLAIVEVVAPAVLHIDRFLPPTPLRVVVDHNLDDYTHDAELASAQLRDGDSSDLFDQDGVTSRLLPAMLREAMSLASEAMGDLVARGTELMNEQLQKELARLEDLHRVNSHVTLEEIASLREQQAAIAAAINGARLRVGGLRLIMRRE